MRHGRYRNLEFTVQRSNTYGQYIIRALYKGLVITVRTTDSQIWDWVDDDSNSTKWKNANRAAYTLIINEAYEEVY